MLKIEIMKNCAGSEMSFYVGEKPTVSNEIGQDLINAGYAELIAEVKDVAVTPTEPVVTAEPEQTPAPEVPTEPETPAEPEEPTDPKKNKK